MKRLKLTGSALATLLTTLLTGNANAADLRPAPVYTKAPMMTPVYSWTGFYFGVNGGYSFGKSDTDITITGVPGGTVSQNMNGWLGGGQFGYNWQAGIVVLGLETDIQGTGQRGSFDISTPAICPAAAVAPLPCSTGSASGDHKLPWFGTARARLGVTPLQNWLLYATGGLAYGGVDSDASFTSSVAFPGGPVIGSTTTSVSSRTTRVGWTVGGGAEWVIFSQWTAKVEYLFMDLGRVDTSFAGTAPFTAITTSSHITDNIVRVGINYRLSGAPAASSPFPTRY